MAINKCVPYNITLKHKQYNIIHVAKLIKGWKCIYFLNCMSLNRVTFSGLTRQSIPDRNDIWKVGVHVGMSWFYIVARKTFACMTSGCCSYVFAVVVVDQENQSKVRYWSRAELSSLTKNLRIWQFFTPMVLTRTIGFDQLSWTYWVGFQPKITNN